MHIKINQFKMKNQKRQDVTINVNAAVTVLYARFIQMNLEGLIQFGKETVNMTDKGAKEFEHITNELLEKSLKIAAPSYAP